MKKFLEEYRTERLIIRKPIIEDANEVYNKYAQDFEVVKYLTWTPHSGIDVTRGFIAWCISQWTLEEQSCFPYSICLARTNELIGMMDFRFDKFKVDFGYALAKKYWKKGYMVETLSPIIKLVLEMEIVYRCWAVCDIENYGSKRVLEKLGMQYEGILKCWTIHPNISIKPRDCHVFSKTKS